MIYDVDYFIDKFSKIPEGFWCTQTFYDGEKCCARGFCQRESYEQDSALIELFGGVSMYGVHVAAINNGGVPEYQQPTPKQRILAALYDIKKAQQPEVKEKTVYVTVDSSVRELQQKELSVN